VDRRDRHRRSAVALSQRDAHGQGLDPARSHQRTVPGTLVELLSTASDRHGSELALIERDGEQFVAITFAELSAAVAALAGELRSRGVVRADVIGVWLPNWTETIVWEFALASLGAATLGINTRYGVHEITHLIERGDPVGVVAPARFLELDFAGRLRRASDDAGRADPPWVAVVRAAGGDDVTDFDIGGGAWTPPPLRELVGCRDAMPAGGRSEDLVNYFTTSGWTGMPKLAGHDQASVAIHGVNVAAALDMRAGDRFLGVLPQGPRARERDRRVPDHHRDQWHEDSDGGTAQAGGASGGGITFVIFIS
jgi:acyl-coenzyme A synthetase/AMP-(fatty) acid ligase